MSICTAPVYELKELNNLFFEMTSKNCNQRCHNCYIKFPNSNNTKDFISIDRVKETILESKNENIYCIYLSGAEPMTHPDFNFILRLCLKRCNVCICTNGSFLNEKKIRFLKKVEDEGVNQIFFKLSVAHWDEIMSDKVKYRGHFRQIISALKILQRYNFVSILSVQNYYNVEYDELNQNLEKMLKEKEIEGIDIQINESYPSNEGYNRTYSKKTDCMFGRVVAQNGIYSCPFLANDYRGRVGSTIKDYSKSINAETDFCLTCAKNNNSIFSIY